MTDDFVGNAIVAFSTAIGTGTLFLDSTPPIFTGHMLAESIIKVLVAVIAGGLTTAFSFYIKYKCNAIVARKAKEKLKAQKEEDGE